MAKVEHIAEGVSLYLGDCREILPTLGKFDAVVTDPPYGVDAADWDKEIPDWLEAAREAAERVAFTTAPTTLWDYPRADWVCAWARPGSPARTAQGGFNHWTPVIAYGVKFPTDMLYLPPVANLQKREYPPGFEHPTPKPLEVMKWLLQAASSVGDLVCDPFMGSGTTGVAAIQLGRKFIGIEREPNYYAVARQRIIEATKQIDLFVQKPEAFKQGALL